MKRPLLLGLLAALAAGGRGYDPEVPVCYDPAGIPAEVARALHPIGLDRGALEASLSTAGRVRPWQPADLRALGLGAVRPDYGAACGAAPLVSLRPVPLVAGPGPAGPVTLAQPVFARPAKCQPCQAPAPAPPLPTPGRELTAGLALLRLQAGDATPALRAALAALPLERVQRELARRRVQPAGDPCAEALVALLVEQHGVTPTADASPRTVALHYAAWLARRGDDRCVPLLEHFLATTPTPRQPGAVLELELLVVYHRRLRRHAAAAATWLRVGQYSRDAATCANYQIEAARDYQAAGQPAAADVCYAKVPQYGYGWATGLALYDQAQRLLANGQLAAAERLLQVPVSGRYADQVAVALESLRARLALAKDDRAAALRHHARTVELYHSLANPLRGEGLEGLLAAAQAALAQHAALSRQSFLVSNQTLDLPARLPADAPLPSLTITAAQPLPLQVLGTIDGLRPALEAPWRAVDLAFQTTLHLRRSGPLPLGPWTAQWQLSLPGSAAAVQPITIRRAAWHPSEETSR